MKIRALFTSIVLLLGLMGAAQAQTALTSTTLSAALTATQTTVQVASATGVSAGVYLFVDREAMRVNSITGTLANVSRGFAGSAARAHITGAVVYVGAASAFSSDGGPGGPVGACTRTAQTTLPRISLPSGNVYDCPVGTNAQWALLNGEGLRTVKSEAFNLDNGSGTTIDAILIRPARDILVTACRIVYEDATAGTVAAGNARVGTTVGGSEIVASTAYTNSATVGSTTAMTIVAGNVSAGTPVLVRHTGVAATVAGEAVVECDYVYR